MNNNFKLHPAAVAAAVAAATGKTKAFKHSYEIETNTGSVTVHANNRAQAAATARRAGHFVRSVNMIG